MSDLLKKAAAEQAAEMVKNDPSKVAGPFGANVPVPVEVVEYGWTSAKHRLDTLGCSTRLRTGPLGRPQSTDGGNLTINCQLQAIGDPAVCAAEIESLVGVIESGLFIGLATEIVIADEAAVRVITFPATSPEFH
jgi:ribose 5-phosphate isomerase A